MPNAHGPDISFYQDDNTTPRGVDFDVMKARPSDFVIIRAGQCNWIDTDFHTNWAAAKAAGLPRGSYWYWDSRVSPEIQAHLWAEALGDDLGEIALFADFEESYGGPWSGWDHFFEFLVELEVIVNKEILIYTRYYYWIDNVPEHVRHYFAPWGLWAARYNTAEPRIAAPWENEGWTFWQYTEHGDGPAYGVESLGIDLNHYNGTVDEFKTRFGLGVVVPPVPPEPPVEPPADDVTIIEYKAGERFEFVLIEDEPEEPPVPYDPSNPPEETDTVEWTLYPTPHQVLKCRRTPNESDGNIIQFPPFYESTILSAPLDEERNHGGNLVRNWNTPAEKENLENKWTRLFIQLVWNNNYDGTNAKMLWTDARYKKTGNPWNLHGVYVLTADLVAMSTPPVIEPPEPPAPPPAVDFPREITIPDDGYSYYQLKHDWEAPEWGEDGSVRQDRKTAPGKWEALPETVILHKELWLNVPEKWRQFQRDCARLDSPSKDQAFWDAAYSGLIVKHRAFTDHGHYRNDEDFDWKVSLSTGGNIVRGYRNGVNLIVDCFDITKDPPNAEDVRGEFWRLHFATQIWPREYRNADGTFTVCRFPDGTFKVTHFPQGRSETNDKTGTTFPLWGQGDTKIIESRHIAKELQPGDTVKIVNLSRDH